MSSKPEAGPFLPAIPLSLPTGNEVLSLLSILETYLPYSLPLYRRLQFYLAHPGDPGRPPHAQIFQASAHDISGNGSNSSSNGNSGSSSRDEGPSDTDTEARVPWLAAHVDMSRSGETQVWIFANWECPEEKKANQPTSPNAQPPPSLQELETRRALLGTFLKFIHTHCVPLMPSTPPASFNCVKKLRRDNHPYSPSAILIGSCNLSIRSLIPTSTIHHVKSHYLKYIFSSTSYSHIPNTQDTLLPPGYRYGALRQPLDLQRALDRTDIPRTVETLALVPSRAIFYGEEPDPVAWGFVGIDASLTTLHTEPGHRRKGLAVLLAGELLRMQAVSFKTPVYKGKEEDERVDGGRATEWGHADVLEENTGSIRVMEKAGGRVMWRDCWIEVELERLAGEGGWWSGAS